MGVEGSTMKSLVTLVDGRSMKASISPTLTMAVSPAPGTRSGHGRHSVNIH